MNGATNDQDQAQGAAGRRWADGWKWALHVFALWAVAVAQPIYDLLGRYPEFFVARRTVPLEILTLTATLSLLAPAALAAGLSAVRLASRRVFRAGLWLAVMGLASAALLPLLKRLPLAPLIVMGLAAAGGGLLALLYVRTSALRLFLSFLAPAALVVPAYFLGFTPAHRLAFPDPPAALGGSKEAADFGPQPSIVMLVFDELSLSSLLDRQGNIDAKRFPNFASLAAESSWFRNATTVAEATHTAVPAIATGLYPKPNKLGNSADYPDNLFTWLSGTHRLRVFESITQLCPVQLCAPRVRASLRTRTRLLAEDLAVIYGHLLLPTQLSRRLPAINRGWGNFRRADWQLQRSLAFYRAQGDDLDRLLKEFEAAEAPTLFFHHEALPHFPWVFLPSGKRYARDNLGMLFLNNDLWVDDPPILIHAFQRYSLQLAFADRQLGRILAALRGTGLIDRSILWVMADHGLNWIPGEPRRSASTWTASQIMPVPLFLRVPGQSQGEVNRSNVETVDIVPTLAELLKRPLPWAADGISVFGRDRDKPRKLLFKQSSPTPLQFSPDFATRTAEGMCLNGKWYQVDPGVVVGSVDNVVFQPDRVVIAGFASDIRNSAPAEEVLIFADGRLVHAAAPTDDRPDVVEFFRQPELLHSGFLLLLDPALFSGARHVRFLGRRGDRVAELHYQDSYPWSAESEASEAGAEAAAPECAPNEGDRSEGFLIRQAEIPMESAEAGHPILKTLRDRALTAGADGVFRGGPGAEYFGADVGDLPAAARPVQALLAHPEDYEAVYPDSGFVPAEVDASFNPDDLGDAAAVLVAINGVVEAAAVPFPFDDRRRILTIIPEDRFIGGRNELQFFALPTAR